MNPKIIKVIKIASVVASVIGMIGSTWADSKENEETLRKLVVENLQKGE